MSDSARSATMWRIESSRPSRDGGCDKPARKGAGFLDRLTAAGMGACAHGRLNNSALRLPRSTDQLPADAHFAAARPDKLAADHRERPHVRGIARRDRRDPSTRRFCLRGAKVLLGLALFRLELPKSLPERRIHLAAPLHPPLGLVIVELGKEPLQRGPRPRAATNAMLVRSHAAPALLHQGLFAQLFCNRSDAVTTTLNPHYQT
jgi:hypothetical protein